MGIVQEEADYNCIAAEEMPLHEILAMRSYVSTLDYNIQQCAKDELLHGIYDEPLNTVRYSLLTYNHMKTICRAFLAKQLWRLAAIVEKDIIFCDNSGRLSLSKCTAHPNCERLN